MKRHSVTSADEATGEAGWAQALSDADNLVGASGLHPDSGGTFMASLPTKTVTTFVGQ